MLLQPLNRRPRMAPHRFRNMTRPGHSHSAHAGRGVSGNASLSALPSPCNLMRVVSDGTRQSTSPRGPSRILKWAGARRGACFRIEPDSVPQLTLDRCSSSPYHDEWGWQACSNSGSGGRLRTREARNSGWRGDKRRGQALSGPAAGMCAYNPTFRRGSVR